MSEQARYEQLLLAMHDIVQDDEAPTKIAKDGEAWLRERGVTDVDAAAMSALGAKRLTLYRRLVRRGLRGAIRIQIPRTAARLEARFAADVDTFFDEVMPSSHYLRDVAFEFVDWASERWLRDAAVHDYLVDLARHELTAFDIAGSPTRRTAAVRPELSLEEPVFFDPVAKIARYGYAVHRLEAAEEATDIPDAVSTALLIYRDAEHDVRYLELSSLAARIVERLMDGQVLSEAMQGAAGDEGRVLEPAVLEGAARVLADLADRGVLLGVREHE